MHSRVFSNSGIWDWHIKTGEVSPIFFDDNYFKISGYVPNEFPHTYEEWKKRVHADDIEKAERRITSYITGKSKEYSAEFRFKTKTNDWMWILSQGKIFEYDDHGNPARFTGTHLDITERKRAEEASKASRKRLSQIISFLPDATFVIDLEGKVIAWNRAIEAMTGVKAEEILGKGNYEYAIPFYGERRPILIDLASEWNEEIVEKYQYVKKEGESLVSETYDPINKPGGFQWGKASLLYDANGEAIGGIESIRDITDIRVAEKTLRESEEKYSKLFHSNPQWLSIATVEDGRYVEVNDAVKKITGYERGELIGRTSKELGLFADYEKRSGFVKIAQEQGGFREKEVVIIKKNGEQVSVLWSAATIEIMGTAYFINSVADISERKQVENKLKESEERFRMFFEQAGDAVFVHNLEERYVEVNERACSSLGYSKDELMAISVADIEVGWEPDNLHALWENLEENKVITTTGEQRRKDGSTFPVEVRLRSIQRDDQKLMMVMARDISFRKQAEEMLRESHESLQKSEERYRSLINATTSIIWTTDASGGFVEPQFSWEKFTGQPWSEQKGFGWGEKIHPDDIKRVLEIWRKACEELSLYETWGRVWNANLKEWRNFEVKAVPIINQDGSLREWVGIMTDVTEHKLAEKRK